MRTSFSSCRKSLCWVGQGFKAVPYHKATFIRESLENPICQPSTEAMRAERTVLEIGPALVFIVDCTDREAMEVNVQPSTRREHKVAPMAVTKREVELAVPDQELSVGFPAPDAPAVPGTDQVVILVDGIGLVEPEEAHFPFHAYMPAQVVIQEGANAQQLVRAVVGAELGEKASTHQVGAALGGWCSLCVEKSIQRKKKQACKQVPFGHAHHSMSSPKTKKAG